MKKPVKKSPKKKAAKKKPITIEYQAARRFEWAKLAMGDLLAKLIANSKPERPLNADEEELMGSIRHIVVSGSTLTIALAEKDGAVVYIPIEVKEPDWSYGDGEEAIEE